MPGPNRLLMLVAMSLLSVSAVRVTSALRLPLELPASFEATYTRAAIVRELGSPTVGLRGALVYNGSYAGVPARITFLFVDAILDEVVIAFLVREPGGRAVREEFARVAKRLRLRYGPARSQIYQPERIVSLHWSDGRAGMVHSIVVGSDHAEHTLRISAAQVARSHRPSTGAAAPVESSRIVP